MKTVMRTSMVFSRARHPYKKNSTLQTENKNKTLEKLADSCVLKLRMEEYRKNMTSLTMIATLWKT